MDSSRQNLKIAALCSCLVVGAALGYQCAAGRLNQAHLAPATRASPLTSSVSYVNSRGYSGLSQMTAKRTLTDPARPERAGASLHSMAVGSINMAYLGLIAIGAASLSFVASFMRRQQANQSSLLAEKLALLAPRGIVGNEATSYLSRSMSMCAASGMSQDELKKLVGYKAVDDHVKSGMVVGLGTGSTAYFAVERVGQKLKSGELKDIVCIPTSVRTKEQAESLGIPLCTLNEKSRIDVSIDGADEVDPDWNLVKGGGGALLREKMVEIVSDKFICIVDESKLCKGLGPGFALPVEITPFCHEHTMRVVAGLPAVAPHLKEAVLRMGSSSSNKKDGDNIAITDNGNYIVDLHFKEMLKDAPAAAAQLKNTVGVVDHGLFIGMTTEVIVAGSEGVYVLPKAK